MKMKEFSDQYREQVSSLEAQVKKLKDEQNYFEFFKTEALSINCQLK
jgi:hypothetical protein